MNIMKADKAPFILVLLLTAAGWQARQLIDEVKTYRAAVSYKVSLDRASNTITAQVRNESPTTTVGVSFSLVCRDGQDCFRERADGRLIQAPPVALPVSMRVYRQIITVDATMPPGGQFAFAGRIRTPDGRADFMYFPGEGNSRSVYLYDRSSLMGFIVGNYLALLTGSLLLTIAAIAAYVMLSGIVRPSRARAGDANDEEDEAVARPAARRRPRRTAPKE